MLRFNRHSFLVLVSVIGVMFVAKNYLLFSDVVPTVLTLDKDKQAWSNVMAILNTINDPTAWQGKSATATIKPGTTLPIFTNFASLKGPGKISQTDLTNAILLMNAIKPTTTVNDVISTTNMNKSGQLGVEAIKTVFKNTDAGAGWFLQGGSKFSESLANPNITEAMLNSFLTISSLLGLSINDVQASALTAAAQRGSASSTTSATALAKLRSTTSAAPLPNNSGTRVPASAPKAPNK